MASRSSASSIDADTNDVSDFLQRIKELGQKRDQEDEERNRKLEEEILQGRKERQARREERARSLSPTKSSPANTPPRNLRRSMVVGDSSRLQEKIESSTLSLSRQSTADDAVERASDGQLREDNTHTLSRGTNSDDTLETLTSQHRNSNPVTDMPVARELSWQQRRPNSERSRSRPLSQVATENASAARTPVTTTSSDDTPLSRDQIAESFGSRDPSCPQKNVDHGIGAAAYKRSSVADSELADHSIGAQLLEISRPREVEDISEGSREVSPNRARRSKTISSIHNMDRTTVSRSPMPMSLAQRLEPPASASTSAFGKSEYGSVGERTPAMSPAQSRISPEKLDRPISPTKGMGGFVQSAMMKRSDSVNKRWSVQSPQGLHRSGSVASNRSSYHPGTDPEKFGELLKGLPMREPTPLSNDHTTRPSSRPPSRPVSTYGGSNATVIQHPIERAETPGSVKSSMTTTTTSTEGLARPQSASSSNEELPSKNNNSKRKDSELPTSPTRTMDPRRWSPTKASWLETALNKPDLVPKPKAPAAPAQPSWMAELVKARQKSVDLGALRNNVAPKHEVSIGGLMRSPAMGGTTKPASLGGISKGLNKTNLPSSEASSKVGGGPAGQLDGRSSPRPASSPSKPTNSGPSLSNPGLAPSTSFHSSDLTKSSSAIGTDKPETPPKKDFRSSLKPSQPPPQNAGSNEVEFKSVFGQLKPTKTQNFVAPDALKDNILRGKSALNATGGPKKTERVDEFKESILQKKKAFEQAQIEGKGVARTVSNSSKEEIVPEAIARRRALALGKEKSPPTPSIPSKPIRIGNPEGCAAENVSQASMLPTEQETVPASAPQKEILAPGRVQAGDKLADRFNPALAGLLARGPPGAASETSRGSTPLSQRSTSMGASAEADVEKPGPKLEHVTKGRARGPRRKAPSSLKKSDEVEVPVERMAAVATPATAAATAVVPARKPLAVDTPIEPDENHAKTTSLKAEEQKPEAAQTISQPPSPHKRTMNINRRSRFLEEVANKNEKLSEPTNPKSPIKKLNLEDIFQAPSSPAKDVGRSPVGKLNHEFLRKNQSKVLDYEDTVGAPASPNRETSTSPAKVLNSAFLSKSPTKALNFEAKAQGHSSPAKEMSKSPVKPMTQPFLPKGPLKAEGSDHGIDGTTKVKTKRVSISGSSTATKEKPVAGPESPSLTNNASEHTGRTSTAPEPIIPNPEIKLKTIVPDLASTFLPVDKNLQDPIKSPASTAYKETPAATPNSEGLGTSSTVPEPVFPKPKIASKTIGPDLSSTPFPQDSVKNVASITSEEMPLAPPKSSLLRMNVFEDPVKPNVSPKPVIPKPELSSKPSGLSLNPASHSIQENLPNSVTSPASSAYKETPAAPPKSEGTGMASTVPEPVVPSPKISSKPIGPDLSPAPLPQDSVRSLASITSKETPVAPPKSPLLTMNASEDQVKMNTSLEPVIPKSKLSSKPTGLSLDSASHPIQEIFQNSVKNPVSPRPLPKPPAPIPAPIAINDSENPLPPSATPKDAEYAAMPMSSASPSKRGFSISQTTEASKLLKDFFGEATSPSPDYKIDTSAILINKPSQAPKISTASCQLYQLAAGGKKTAIQLSRETTLFESNLYICVHTFKAPFSFMKTTEVYFWIGDEVEDAVIQDAEAFATREAKAAGGKLIVLRQGRESLIFFHALGGMVIIRRGTSNKYDSLAPYILCGRQHLGFMVFDEVDFSPSSLSSGFPYIVNSRIAKIWLWKGKGSSAIELSHAKTLGAELAIMGPMEEVEEGSEPDEFLKVFGDGKIKIRGGAGHWKLKANYAGYRGRLFKVDVLSITEVWPFDQKSISPHHIYVLDAFFEIYIIIGAHSGASSDASPLSQSSNGGSQGNQYRAFHVALQFAQEYAILSAGMEDRPFVPVSTVVVEGMPRDARVVVRKWSDKVLTTKNPDNSSVSAPPNGTSGGFAPGSILGGLKRGRSLRVVPLMVALEATRS